MTEREKVLWKLLRIVIIAYVVYMIDDITIGVGVVFNRGQF